MTPVNEQTILDALYQIPSEHWDEVLRYLKTLNTGPSPIRTADDLLTSDLVGIWADRDDIGESRTFACGLRRKSETRHRDDDADEL